VSRATPPIAAMPGTDKKNSTPAPAQAIGSDQVARGFLGLVGGAAAVSSALLLKIPLETSFSVWSFSKDELDELQPIVETCVDKYLPKLSKWGPEAELAGKLAPMLAGKVAAVILAAKIFRLQDVHKIPPAAVTPSKPANVTAIRPAENPGASTAAPPQTDPTITGAVASSKEASAPLPDPFSTKVIDGGADLLAEGLL